MACRRSTPTAVFRSSHGAHVHAAHRGVPGERGARAVPLDDPPELVDVVGQTLGWHRRVFDERVGALGAGRAHEQRQRGAAQLPGLGQGGRIGKEDGGARAQVWGATAAQAVEAGKALVARALVFDQQHGRVVAVEDGAEAREALQVGRAAQRRQVDELDGRGPRRQDGEVGLERGAQAGEGERRPAAATRAARRAAPRVSVNSSSVPSEPASRRARLGCGSSSSGRL